MWENAIPQAVFSALERLEHAGYPAYLVGGCVRDLLRGVTPHDFDITTAALPEQTKAVFANHKLVETGIRHGTVTVFADGLPLEITTYRTDGSYSDGRHPDFVRFGDSLEEDLRRRDFTVNAMAWSPKRGLVDLFGGQSDLQNGIIRCVGDPETRFREDALRIMRGVRFASCLDYSVEQSASDAILRLTPLLAQVSPERIAAELTRLLCGKRTGTLLREYRELFAFLLPELRPCFDFDQQNPHHCYDVYTHICAVVDGVMPEPTVRLAALFHDIAKPQSFGFWDGKGHFKGHPARSAAVCEAALRRLRMSNRTVRDVCLLVRMHDFALEEEDTTPLAFLRRVPRHLQEMLFSLMQADALAKADPDFALQKIRTLQDGVNELSARPLCLSVRELAVNGSDLLALGVPAGKRVGELLQTLLEKVLAGTVENTRDDLLLLAKQLSKG